MPPELPLTRRGSPAVVTPEETPPFVSEESLVLRNYDSTDSHDVTVRLLDATDEVAFRRTYTLDPTATVTVCTRLSRGVYRVEARLDEERTTSVDCLIGSGPDETALVEVGNGVVSVAEGLL